MLLIVPLPSFPVPEVAWCLRHRSQWTASTRRQLRHGEAQYHIIIIKFFKTYQGNFLFAQEPFLRK